MSKRYFINNIDEQFGKTLLSQLVKQQTQDPIHMCTSKTIMNKKPNGIKKIVKRQKPKLYRKKIIEQCDVYVYQINSSEITDIQFGIQTMNKNIQDNKVFILVSDLMVWSNSGKKIKKQIKKKQQDQNQQDDGSKSQKKNLQEKKSQPEKQSNQQQNQHQQQSKQQQNQNKAQKQQQQHQQQLQYTYFEDIDYKDRKPLQKYEYIKKIQQKVLQIKKQNIKIFIICPGLIYGCGQNNLFTLFKAAWLQLPKQLPYLRSGNNQIPMIHLKDLVKFVIQIAQNPPEQCSPYLLAFDMNQNKTQKSIIESISKGIGSGQIVSVEKSDIFPNQDIFLIDIDIRASKCLVGSEQQPVQFEWTSKKGIGQNIPLVLEQFCKKHQLRPMKLLLIQNQLNWKSLSQIQFIQMKFSQYYRIPILTIQNILQQAKDKGNNDLKNDIAEQQVGIKQYLLSNSPRKLDQTMKVFYRMIRWRLAQNDCSNRGYILQNFPHFKQELDNIFLKVPSKKFKRKKKPIPKPKPIKKKQQKIQSQQIIEQKQQVKEDSSAKKQENQQDEQKQQKSNQSDEEEQNDEEKKPEQPPVQQKKQQKPKQQQPEPQPQPQPQPQQQQPEQEAEQGAPKYQLSFPESVISIKQVGKESLTQVIEFCTTRGIQQLIYDTTGTKQSQIFQSLRTYIERNGRPNNYLVEDSELLRRHIDFINEQNQMSIKQREKVSNDKNKRTKDVSDQRNKLRDEITDVVRTEGEEEIKKMPFRNYLMEFVVPTLNQGLLQVSNIIPNDPVDLLAQYLYQKSYDF